MSKDYYEILGVSKDADIQTIKRAYRKLAAKYHPDRNKEPGAEDRFKEVQNAYEVLSDPQKRKAYDTYGEAGVKGFNQDFDGNSYGGYSYNWQDIGSIFDMGDVSSLFDGMLDSFFGGSINGRSRRKNSAKRGDDIRIELELPFEIGNEGGEKEISYKAYTICPICNGTGSKTGKLKTCTKCGGKGVVQNARSSLFGQMIYTSICDKCEGSGNTPEETCPNCKGVGRTVSTRSIKIKIPKGSYTGVILKFKHGGNAGLKGGENGDLYIALKVKEYKNYRRDRENLYTSVNVPPYIMTLGGRIKLETPYGLKYVDIQAGSQHGEIVKLKNMGAYKLGEESKGDLYINLNVIIPRRISSREKKLWEEIRNINEQNN